MWWFVFVGGCERPETWEVTFASETVFPDPTTNDAAGGGTCATLRDATVVGGSTSEALYATVPVVTDGDVHVGWYDGPFPFADDVHVPLGETAVMVVRRAPDGETRWWAKLEGSTQATLQEVAVGGDGSVWAAGSGDGLSTFAAGPPLAGAYPAESDLWVARLDPDGQLMSTFVAGSTQDDSAYSVTALPDGGAIAAGAFEGDLPLGEVLLPLPDGTQSGGWIARIEADGKVVWATSLAGASGTAVVNVAADPAGETFVASGVVYGEGQTVIGAGTPTERALTPFNYDHFLVSYDAWTGTPRWATALTGGYAIGRDLDVFADGSVVAAGLFDGDLQLDDAVTLTDSGSGGSWGWVARWDAAGGLVFASTLASTAGLQQVRTAPLPGGETAVAGSFSGILTIGEGVRFVADEMDGYLARFGPTGELMCGLHLRGQGADVVVDDVHARPDGAVQLVGSLSGKAHLTEEGSVVSAGARDWLVLDVNWLSHAP